MATTIIFEMQRNIWLRLDLCTIPNAFKLHIENVVFEICTSSHRYVTFHKFDLIKVTNSYTAHTNNFSLNFAFVE